MASSEDLQAEADAHVWFHSIDLGDGVVTKGIGKLQHERESLPDFSGRSVLDIGAWDGYYSFLAERSGARRVVALDHYAWGVNFGARNTYWQECVANGTFPDPSRDVTDFWAPELPGRRAFEFARATLNSTVEPMLGDYATMDLTTLGVFDIVLYLGVLYHMKDPLLGLERVRSLTKEVAVIETEAVHLQYHDAASLLQFHAGDSLRADFTNWYVPTIEGLHAMCRAAGFSSVRTIVGPPERVPTAPESRRERLGRRVAGHPPQTQASAPSANYRAVVHAFP